MACVTKFDLLDLDLEISRIRAADPQVNSDRAFLRVKLYIRVRDVTLCVKIKTASSHEKVNSRV
jgi:hypothetical protein